MEGAACRGAGGGEGYAEEGGEGYAEGGGEGYAEGEDYAEGSGKGKGGGVLARACHLYIHQTRVLRRHLRVPKVARR